MRGLEPPTFGTTIRRSNQLSYNHRLKCGANILQILLDAKQMGKNLNQIRQAPDSQISFGSKSFTILRSDKPSEVLSAIMKAFQEVLRGNRRLRFVRSRIVKL